MQKKSKRCVLAIDPGNEFSAYVFLDYKTYKPIRFGLVPNEELHSIIETEPFDFLAIEMIASYGMAVGKTVFDTCVWIGRFIEQTTKKGINYRQVYRLDEKMDICHTTKANDSNIRQALIDRFGVVGTKKDPGFFYGFKKDIWQAFAVGCTYIDKENNGEY